MRLKLNNHIGICRCFDNVFKGCGRTCCFLSVIIILMMGLVGCNGKNRQQRITDVVAKIKAKPAGEIEPFPPIKPLAQETYTAKHLRNPFMRTRQAKKGGQQPDLARPKEPLEEFPLDSLKMVGTITQNNKVWALVVAPDGTVYPVTLGNRIGQHFGKIVKIRADQLELLESLQIGGEWQKRKAILSMSQ